MDVDLINKVARQTQRGRSIQLRQNEAGHGVLKVDSGPFGLLKKRYTTDIETWNVIREIVSRGQPGRID